MKNLKLFSLTLVLTSMALLAVTSLQAVNLEGNPPPNLSARGGGMDDGGVIIQGKIPRATGGMGVVAISMSVSITAGQAVALTGSPNTLAVTLTATAGDTKIYGVAITSATAGNPVQVVTTSGSIVRVDSAVNVTANSIYISSGTAGKITAASAVTESLYTSLSKTAWAFRAVETRTITAANPYVLVEILK